MLTDRGDWKQMSFGAARGRYVTVKVIHAGGGDVDAYCSMAELKFYGTAVPDPVAKDDLATAIEKVDAEVAAGDLKAGDYTEASWTALENALASARAILSDEDATQDEVDQALRRSRAPAARSRRPRWSRSRIRLRSSSRPWSSRRRRLTPGARRTSLSRP